MSMDYVTAVRTEIVKSRSFLFVPARGEPHDVELQEDGRVATKTLFDSWEVRLGGVPHKEATLFLYAKKQLFASLGIRSSGSWEGRERGGGTGYQAIRPPVERIARWKLLSNPVAFQAAQLDDVGFAVSEPLPAQLDWDRYGYNLEALVDRDSIPQSNMAVALIACDRFAYFQRVAQSLARNPEMQKLPVFLFLDRPANEQKMIEVDQQAELCRKLFPQSVVVKHPRNFGCGRNIIDARIQLFTNMKYEYVFVFEDDLVVAPDYMRLTLRLMEWAEAHYDNVAAVQAWNLCNQVVGWKQQRLNEVHVTYTNWWGYLMRKDAWDSMMPDVLEYQSLFLGGSYSGRPHRSIVEWFRAKAEQTEPATRSKRFPIDSESVETWENYFKSPPTGQDALTMTCMESNGWMRLATTVNRGEYIGRQGIHMNPRRFIQDGYDAVCNNLFAEDATMSDFQPRGQSRAWIEDKLTVEALEGSEHFKALEG